MGVWGVGLYASDEAEDARDDFRDIFSVKSAEEATELIMKQYSEEFFDEDLEEASIYWYALADWQWNKGILQPQVKQKALDMLEQGIGIEEWREDGSKSNIKKRIEVLEKLKNKLLSPQPVPKKIRNSNLHYKLKPGDIIAIRTNERFVEEIEENQTIKKVSRYNRDYVRQELLRLYSKYYDISFKENYKPIIEKECYIFMLCVKKEKWYNRTWNIPELYDESIEFAYYDFYSKDLSNVKEKLEGLSFFKMIDEFTGERYLMTTDDFFGFCLEKYKLVAHSDKELEKFQKTQSDYKFNPPGRFWHFLWNYELFHNPLIEYKEKGD